RLFRCALLPSGWLPSPDRRPATDPGQTGASNTTTMPLVDSLSPRQRSGERVRERGFQLAAPIRWKVPLSPALSPLVPRREREQGLSTMVVVSRCADAGMATAFLPCPDAPPDFIVGASAKWIEGAHVL